MNMPKASWAEESEPREGKAEPNEIETDVSAQGQALSQGRLSRKAYSARTLKVAGQDELARYPG